MPRATDRRSRLGASRAGVGSPTFGSAAQGKVSAEYRRRLEALRELYLEQLPQRIKTIEEALARLGRERWDQERLESLYLLAHRLAGSAGVYQVDAVAAAADRLEVSIRTILEGPDPPAHFEGQLQALVGELARASPAFVKRRKSAQGRAERR